MDADFEIGAEELIITTELLGSGAFAKVYKGIWQKEVAVKTKLITHSIANSLLIQLLN